MLRNKALIVLACLAASSSIHAEVLFQMNYAAGSYPNSGWPDAAIPESANFVRRHLPGAGPSGQNVIELQQLSCPGCGSFGGQYNWGWRGGVEPDPGIGAVRYYRWRMYITPDTNYHGLGWGDGDASNLKNKLLMVGQGCGAGNCRFIMNHQGERSSGLTNFIIQKDGGVDEAETGFVYNRGQWLNIQVELRASSSPGAANGSYRLWVNNNTQGSPTLVRSNIVLNSDNWDYVWIGAFNNDGLASDGVHKWRFTDFQVANTFDANWNGGGTTPFSACDLDHRDGITVTDVQLCANQVVGSSACNTCNIDSTPGCSVTDVQRVVNAVFGGACGTP